MRNSERVSARHIIRYFGEQSIVLVLFVCVRVCLPFHAKHKNSWSQIDVYTVSNIRNDEFLVPFDLDVCPWDLFSTFRIRKLLITWKLLVKFLCNFTRQCILIGITIFILTLCLGDKDWIPAHLCTAFLYWIPWLADLVASTSVITSISSLILRNHLFLGLPWSWLSAMHPCTEECAGTSPAALRTRTLEAERTLKFKKINTTVLWLQIAERCDVLQRPLS